MCRVEYATAMLYTYIPEAWCLCIVCALLFYGYKNVVVHKNSVLNKT